MKPPPSPRKNEPLPSFLLLGRTILFLSLNIFLEKISAFLFLSFFLTLFHLGEIINDLRFQLFLYFQKMLYILRSDILIEFSIYKKRKRGNM